MNERSQPAQHTTDERFYPGCVCVLINSCKRVDGIAQGPGKLVELTRKLTSGPRAIWESKWVGIETDSDCEGTVVREHEIRPVSTVADEIEAGIRA